MEQVLAHHLFDVAAQERLASGKGLSQSTARYLIDADWACDSAKERAARKVGGNALVRWLANSCPTQCSSEAGAELIRTWWDWAEGKKLPARLCRGLVDKRPDLHPAVIAMGPGHGLFELVLASRHFSSRALAEVAIAQIKAVGVRAWSSRDAASQWELHSYAKIKQIRSAERALRRCEQYLGTLIENPAVDPELATMAHDAVASCTSCAARSGANLAERAYLQRRNARAGEYDPMAGALSEPYEQISDEAVLAYLLERLAKCNDGFALAALARNPQLGKHTAAVAAKLRFGLGWDLSVAERAAVLGVFGTSYPEYADELAREMPTGPKGAELPAVPTPTYLAGDLSEHRSKRGGTFNPVACMPERYPLALSLIAELAKGPLNGVAHYVAKRLGKNATAWQTCFALADELASSDLDTLCDTALALSE
jgi:hypothetical protein